MGYTTEFEGRIDIQPSVTPELRDYINTLASTRRMKRNVEELQRLYNGEHGYNGSYGIEGEYFAREDGDCGQSQDGSIIECNRPPSTQPQLWLQWNITEDGNAIEWDGGEKFYESAAWMEYVVDNFLKPNGYKCNGEILAQGEEMSDRWKLIINDNNVVKEYIS